MKTLLKTKKIIIDIWNVKDWGITTGKYGITIDLGRLQLRIRK